MSGVHLGRSYVNHVMARDMPIALAFVIRQKYVIKPAQESLALGLMIDESVDVSKSENMRIWSYTFVSCSSVIYLLLGSGAS